MADNRVTKERLAEHWRYGWWKYAILAVATVLGVDLLFSVTAYRPPEEKKLQLYLCNGYADAQALQELLWPDLLAACPEQEELTAANIDVLNGDSYTQLQFSTYVAAQEGDVMLLPLKEARTMASEGADAAFLELTLYVESGVIPVGDIDLTAGRMKDAQGQTGLYAIPADTLTGLRDYRCDPSGAVLVAMAYGGNDGAAATLMGQMIERFAREPDEADEHLGEGTRLLQ